MKALLAKAIKRFVIAPSSGQHWDLLDGLRGVAILMVVFCHGTFANPHGPTWTLWLSSFVETGSLGVQMFFVLSGFLIAYPFCRARAEGSPEWYARGYATRRLLKIAPPFYLTIVLLIAFYLLRYGDVRYLVTGLKWAVGIPQVVYEPRYFNGSFWSLWVEIGFYLVLPAAFWLTRGRSLLFSVGFFALVLFCVPLVTRSLSWPPPEAGPGYLLFRCSRFPNALTNFSWGVLFAGLYAARRREIGRCRSWAWLGYIGLGLLIGTMGLGMVLAQTHLVSGHVSLELLVHLTGVSTFLMLFFIFDAEGLGNRALSLPMLRYIGLVSYEWFLLHQPILLETRDWAGGARGAVGRYCLIVFTPMLLSLLLAMMIYHFFSTPIIRWGRARLEASRGRAGNALSSFSSQLGRKADSVVK